jgi:hypothetical protein
VQNGKDRWINIQCETIVLVFEQLALFVGLGDVNVDDRVGTEPTDFTRHIDTRDERQQNEP